MRAGVSTLWEQVFEGAVGTVAVVGSAQEALTILAFQAVGMWVWQWLCTLLLEVRYRKDFGWFEVRAGPETCQVELVCVGSLSEFRWVTPRRNL